MRCSLVSGQLSTVLYDDKLINATVASTALHVYCTMSCVLKTILSYREKGGDTIILETHLLVEER